MVAQVWEDLLGFEGAEFYFKHWPELIGCTFGEVLLRFDDAVPCGVRLAAKGRQVCINPPDSYVLQAGDEVLVIAEDDDSYEPGAPRKVSVLGGEIHVSGAVGIRMWRVCPSCESFAL